MSNKHMNYVHAALLILLMLLITMFIGCSKPAFANKTLELNEKNTVAFIEEVTQQYMEAVATNIVIHYKLDKEATQYVIVNSPGGSVAAMNYFVEFLKAAPDDLKLEFVILKAYSAAALIPELVDFRRSIHKDGTMLFHRIRVGNYMPAHLMAEWLKYVLTEEDRIFGEAAKRMSIAKSTLLDKSSKEWYMDAHAAYYNKAVDEVVELRCSDALKSAMNQVDMQLVLFCDNK